MKAKTKYDYPVKQESRKRLRNFVRKLDKARRQMKVVCFPGAEAREITDVYDELRIPRENIVGIERDAGVLSELESKGLGIRLFHGTDLDFFSGTDERFDVISLDYQGTMNDEAVESLREIAGRKLLGQRGVLATNFYGMREALALQRKYLEYLFMTHGQIAHLTGITKNAMKRFGFSGTSGDPQRNNTILRYLEDLKEDLDENRIILGRLPDDVKEAVGIENLKEIRSRAIPANIIGIFWLVGSKAEAIDEALKGMGPVRDILKKTLKSGELDAANLPVMMMDLMRRIGNGGLDPKSYVKAYGRYLEARGAYFPESVESFSYLADDGSLMLSDHFMFMQHTDLIKEAKKVRPGSISRGELVGIRDLQRKIIRAVMTALPDFELSEREFIGSSYRPRLTGEKYYRLRCELSERGMGKDDAREEAMRRFRTTRGQISAFEAHVTMGTYGPEPGTATEEPGIAKAVAEVMREEPVTVEYPDPTEESVERKYSEAAEPRKEKERAEHVHNINPLAHRKAVARLSEGQRKRMEYFLEDISELLHGDKARELTDNIRESGWYKGGETGEHQLYAFFDDITLAVRRGGLPGVAEIRSMYRNVLQEVEA